MQNSQQISELPKFPLHDAARNNNLQQLESLLKIVDPNIQNQNENTALHSAAEYGYTEATGLISADNRTNPNIKDAEGMTALFVAALNGYTEAVGLILANPKTDYSVQNNDGITPLDAAIVKGYTEIIKLFIEAGVFNDMSKPDAKKAFCDLKRHHYEEPITCIVMKAQKDLNIDALKIMEDLVGNFSESIGVKIEDAMYNVQNAMERQTLLKKVADKIIQQERGNASDDNQKDIETLLKNLLDKFKDNLDFSDCSDTDEEEVKDIIAKEIQDIIGQNGGDIIQEDHPVRDIGGNIVESYLK